MSEAYLLVSFGGPEAPEQVLPFLERVTRGRGVPRERLEQVAQHYLARGGRSPINDRNRELVAALGAELRRRGDTAPLYWGNRNSPPELGDALQAALQAGARSIRVLTTSAYPSYSGCRQYREDVSAALAALRKRGVEGSADVQLEFCEHAWDTAGFLRANVDAVAAAWNRLGVAPHEHGAILFTTHSIPAAMNAGSGPSGEQYTATHQVVLERVIGALAATEAAAADAELVYCSRSGPPQVPWLEPDINDRIRELATVGVDAVVVAPIGFISDHMEVVHDLDTEARGTADQCGVRFARAATVGTHPAFVAALVDLLTAQARTCPVDCCPPPLRRG